MKDIVGAIAEEENYLINREINKDISLLDNIRYCGYDNLNDYFSDKVDYTLRQSGVKIITANTAAQAMPIIQTAFSERINTYAELGEVEPLFIWKGTDTLNEEACATDNVPIHEIGYVGGTIVTGIEDYNFIIILDKAIDTSGGYFLKRLYKFISQYEDNVILDNNDILIDGKKVIGAAGLETDTMRLYTTQATFIDRSEAVKKYCNVPSVKSPGIFKVLIKEQLRSEVLSWLQ